LSDASDLLVNTAIPSGEDGHIPGLQRSAKIANLVVGALPGECAAWIPEKRLGSPEKRLGSPEKE
jgi:hypothetical protein